MRVAFPTNNQKSLTNHIGLAKGFLIVDTDTNEKFYIENPILKEIKENHINLKETQEGQRGLGTGRVIPPLLAEAGVDVLVSKEFGEGMLRNLEREGISPVETDKQDIEEILAQLDEIEEVESGFRRGYGPRFNRGFGYGYGFGNGFGRGCRRGGFGRGRGFGRGMGFRRGW